MSKGKFAEATEAFDRCIAECGHSPLGTNFESHGEEPKIVALQYKGLVLAIRGFLNSGLQTTRSALSLASTINFPLALTFASDILEIALLLRRDYLDCASLAKEQLDYCAEHGFVFWSAAHELLHGAALGALNGDMEGVVEAETGILNWRKTGAGLHVPTYSAFLADAALAAGDLERAERALADGIETANRHAETYALAELERLTGRLRKRQNRRDEARRAFDRAVEIARAQDAGLYLLRAGRDLAQILAEEGEVEGARDLLAPIVGGVTEHKTGLDYQDSSALLAALAG